jgi:3-methyladenine DNA glycosylase AlkC
MQQGIKLKEYFGKNLAELLASKIIRVHKKFPQKDFIEYVAKDYQKLELKDRVNLISESLKIHLPDNYANAIDILLQIFGEPNPNETGMFSSYSWLLPVSAYIENYGLEDFDLSMQTIYQLTQRCTGEYAVRPFIRKYPKSSLVYFSKWSLDNDFHVRRLSSEGLRPKLPWAKKLDLFIDNYQPVFDILENLKEDQIKFVQKSVANNLNDYLKVNFPPTMKFLNNWAQSDNKHTLWIIKHAQRNLNK